MRGLKNCGASAEIAMLRMSGSIIPLVFLVALVTSSAQAETIAAAEYASPVDRYGHFALGQPHEYARLIVTSDSGHKFALQLPDNEVFEDLTPRLVRLAPEGPIEILAIVSRRNEGARLVVIQHRGERLELSAESPAIGTPMRWLNPVGVADLDGDSTAEIALVTTPHIGGMLRVFRRQGAKLVEIAALPGFSNHVLGSPELGLSMPLSIAGKMRLLVPDTTRRYLRIAGLEDGRLVELGRCPLPAPLIGAISAVSPTEISVGLSTGRQTIPIKDCLLLSEIEANCLISNIGNRSSQSRLAYVGSPQSFVSFLH